MKLLYYGLILALMTGLAGAGQICHSGDYIVDTDAKSVISIVPARLITTPPAQLTDTMEMLGNPGFETGSLPPWSSSMWQVVSSDYHSGVYCAADLGNYTIQQDITPVLTDSIVSITFWSRQPEAQIQAFDFFYSDNTYDEDIVWVQTTWQQFNVTTNLPAGKTLIRLGLWGYSGGPPQPDSTYTDDISIMKLTPTGQVEEVAPPARRSGLSVSPNPVRDRAVIEWTGLKNETPAFAIYDLSGAIVERGFLMNGEYVWSTANLIAGIYFIRIDVGNGRSATNEILVIK